MGIAGCYVLHLECEGDVPAGERWHGKPFISPDAQYSDPTRADCIRHARRQGWKINLKTGQTMCPFCVEKKRNWKS